jgi:Flp pilus assembly secretin CpaC
MAMRRSVLALAAAVSLAAAAAQAQTLVAPIDQSITLTFPAAARDIVIGNPLIADVNLINARNAVLIGKAYGVTSVQVFDTDGRSIYARQVVVSSADDNRVSYFRGAAETSFACAPRCERTAEPGGGGQAAAPAAPATP